MKLYVRGWQALILPLLLSPLSQSCVSEPKAQGGNESNKNEAQYFDFKTTKTVALDLRYGAFAANDFLEIYTSDPYEGSTDGTITKDASFSIFTDDNGSFRGNVTLPSYAETIWVVAHGFGLPTVVSAKIANNTASFNISDDGDVAKTVSRRAAKAAGALDEPILLNKDKKLYSITDVETKYGRINYSFNSSLFSKGQLSPASLKSVQYLLWGHKDKKVHGLDNSKYAVDAEDVNTTISRTNIVDGKTMTVESAKVYLTLLHESAHRQNSIGYYYYKTGETPANADNLEKFIIVPNVSMKGDHPYIAANSGNGPFVQYGSSQENKRIQLLFRDPATGKMTEDFPSGYTIGYFVICDGWNSNVSDGSFNNKHFGGIRTSGTGIYPYFYSNADFHESYWGKRFLSLGLADGSVVYGVESSLYRYDKDAKANKDSDLSMEDILFTIDASPNYAIKNPARPTVDPELSEIVGTETTYHTYAFEDIWPYGGDYDLNDVIVEHKREMTFSSKGNSVQKIVDTFTPVQPAGSAAYQDAFAIQLGIDDGMVENMQLSDGMTYESDTRCIIVTEDAARDLGKTFTVTRIIKNGLAKENVTEDLNPFIIAGYKKNDMARTEMHLPKHKATSRANTKLINTGKDAYYVDKDGAYPFAISLPIRKFVPSPEYINIGKTYLKFDEWAASKGAKSADWYLYMK